MLLENQLVGGKTLGANSVPSAPLSTKHNPILLGNKPSRLLAALQLGMVV